jgi:hypothetical protein
MPISINNTTITFNDATTQTTAGLTSAVTSAVAGNGVAVSAATGAVTFSASCPTFNTVGSYVYAQIHNGLDNTTYTVTSGSNYSAGSGSLQVTSLVFFTRQACGNPVGYQNSNNLSGTWKWMANGGTVAAFANGGYGYGLACRVS